MQWWKHSYIEPEIEHLDLGNTELEMQDERLITEVNSTFHTLPISDSVFMDFLQWMEGLKEPRVMGLETIYWKRLANKHTEGLEEQKKRWRKWLVLNV